MSLPSRREILQAGTAAALAAGLGVHPAPAASAEIPKRAGGPRFKVGNCGYSYRQYLQDKTKPMTYAEFLDASAQMNIDGVELTSYYFPTPVTLADINRLTRHAFLLGLEVCGTAVGNNFCLPSGDERSKQIANVKQWLDYAGDMGARQIRIFAGALPKEPKVDEATGRKWVVECLEECLPKAEENGVILALENHGGVVSDANGILAILNAVKSDWLGMKWDCGNFRTADPYADLARTVNYAVTTHIKTEVATPDGQKKPADLERVISILRDAGYRGYLILEYEAKEEPKVAVPRILADLQRLAQKS